MSSENVICRLSEIISRLFLVVWLAKCVPTILELNWYERFVDQKKKLTACHQVLTSSTQLHKRSLHVVDWTKTAAKCTTMKKARAKRGK